MPFLSLTDGVTTVEVPVDPSGSREVPVIVGDHGSRSFNGGPRSSITDVRRSFSVQTGLVPQTDADTLRTLLIKPTLTASGDWIGGSPLTAWPTFSDEKPIGTSPVTYVFTFTLDA
jgi:hypothetical protein